MNKGIGDAGSTAARSSAARPGPMRNPRIHAQIFLPASAAISQAAAPIHQTKAKKLLFGRPAQLL